jgi:hypothetical protein
VLRNHLEAVSFDYVLGILRPESSTSQLGVNGIPLVLGVAENPAAKVRTAVRLHTTLTLQFLAISTDE